MISENKDLGAGEKVSLAHAPPFSVGTITVRPATREVQTTNGRVVLEPRVMQVFVALARANGEVVTRDDLIAACWEGRVVSEDAINRVISKLRGLAEGAAAGAFAIETITKVGYRLTATEGSAQPPRESSPPAKAGFDRRWLIAGGAATAVAGGALIWSRQPAIPAQAQELYRTAVESFSNSDPAQRAQGAAFLREAVALAPDYADAWAALALVYVFSLYESPPEKHEELFAGAKDAAARALALDPENADAHGALAMLPQLFGNWAEAEKGLRAVLKRRPRYAPIEAILAYVLLSVGRIRESLPLKLRAQAAAPLDPGHFYGLAVTYWYADRLEDAQRTIERAYALSPISISAFFGRVHILMSSGKARQALAMLEDEASRPLGIPASDFDLLIVVAKALITGDARDRAAAISTNMSAAAKGIGYAKNASLFAGWLGDKEAALDAATAVFFNRPFKIANAYFSQEQGFYVLYSRETDFLFAPPLKLIRTEKRFEDIVAEIGLDAYWRTTGTIPDYRRGL
jgi:DNA-binding winged helix-turn-helix (wHTH) protein/tetratricopeptide (TPR) repeat protein